VSFSAFRFLCINLTLFSRLYGPLGEGATAQLASLLAEHRHIGELHLMEDEEIPLDLKDYQPLRDAFKSLRKLSFSNMRSGAEKILLICSALACSSKIEELGLYDCEMGPDGANAVADLLMQSKSMTSLRITCDNLGKQGLVCLGNALKRNTTLTFLKLFRIPFSGTHEGEVHFLESLAANKSLQGVEICDLTVAANAALALLMKENQSISSLWIMGELGAPNSFEKVCEGLRANSSLRKLSLFSHGLVDRDMILISAALKENRFLVQLELQYNKITAAGGLRWQKRSPQIQFFAS